jgi:hypothetical protein
MGLLKKKDIDSTRIAQDDPRQAEVLAHAVLHIRRLTVLPGMMRPVESHPGALSLMLFPQHQLNHGEQAVEQIIDHVYIAHRHLTDLRVPN